MDIQTNDWPCYQPETLGPVRLEYDRLFSSYITFFNWRYLAIYHLPVNKRIFKTTVTKTVMMFIYIFSLNLT